MMSARWVARDFCNVSFEGSMNLRHAWAARMGDFVKPQAALVRQTWFIAPVMPSVLWLTSPPLQA